jgi:aerotaxis receptor
MYSDARGPQARLETAFVSQTSRLKTCLTRLQDTAEQLSELAGQNPTHLPLTAQKALIASASTPNRCLPRLTRWPRPLKSKLPSKISRNITTIANLADQTSEQAHQSAALNKELTKTASTQYSLVERFNR